MTNEEREARNGLLFLNLEAPPEVCRDVRLKIEAWVAAAERTVRAKDAALVRAAGCLADSGDYGGACWVLDGEGERRRARIPEEHDAMCPQALAAAIEEGKP